ncbi:hypothetical protein K3A88_06925 [Streptomyces geysiriensis]|nr:hypothetical protein [Streptomyces geysiriensis]
MGPHSARHLRRVLRLYLVRSGLADVTDPAEPALTYGGVLDEGGRGPVIVAAVSDRWGVTPYGDGQGKTVWFECLSRAAPPAPRP